MREMLVFAVHDRKSGVHSTPFFKLTMGEAMRDFEDACRDERTVMFRHPEDFSLVHLGKFDQVAGSFNQGGGFERAVLAHADEFRKVGVQTEIPKGQYADFSPPAVRSAS